MDVNTIPKQLLFSTVRIEAFDSQMQKSSVGTAFVVSKKMNETHQILFMVTNKHVVNETDESGKIIGKLQKGKIFFTTRNGEQPNIGSKFECTFENNFTDEWFGHEDENTDIAIMPLPPIIESAKKAGVNLFYKSIPLEIIPTDEQEKMIDALEEVIFIGYPNGIFDTKNLIPITRRGITATPYFIDFEGQKIFLIDASVFPGSSGSPVLIYKSGRLGAGIMTGDTVYFCGVISKTIQRMDEGKLVVKPIPTSQKIVSQTSQMIDLGIVYKASLIEECINQFYQKQDK